jgi:hypothetical protein
MHMRLPMLAVTLSLTSTAAFSQVTTYDPVTGVVTIPSVAVGSASYTQVTLKDRGDFVFELTGAREQRPAMSGAALAGYDTATGVLTLPAVKVGNETFFDVKLANSGNFAFTLQSAAPMPAGLQAELASYFRSAEAVTATAIPTSGAARLAAVDSCWASSGRTRANFIADWEVNADEYVQRDAFLIGRRFENIQVLDLRTLTNADGSARREVSVLFDTVHKDGTAVRGATGKLVSGSSAGTPGCNTPQTGSGWRDLGNQELVSMSVRGNNIREQRYAIAGGAALNPAVRYRREIEFRVSDPMGNATYAIVTGPGPTNTTSGVVRPFSMKLLSVRLLRSASELQGKTGNFLNWPDDDMWRYCVLPSGFVPTADLVDCVANPGSSNVWGWGFTAAPDAAADAGFVAQGWEEGGVYRFDIYNDDGWKTVNGHANKTPVATYYATLMALPYSFAQMADKYPLFNLGNLTGTQIAANANSASPAPLSLSWAPPGALPGPLMHLYQIWEFHQGAKIGNPGTTFNPAYRIFTPAYPGTMATSTSSFPAAPRHPDQANKTYVEYVLLYRDPTTGNTVRSRINLQ